MDVVLLEFLCQGLRKAAHGELPARRDSAIGGTALRSRGAGKREEATLSMLVRPTQTLSDQDIED